VQFFEVSQFATHCSGDERVFLVLWDGFPVPLGIGECIFYELLEDFIGYGGSF